MNHNIQTKCNMILEATSLLNNVADHFDYKAEIATYEKRLSRPLSEKSLQLMQYIDAVQAELTENLKDRLSEVSYYFGFTKKDSAAYFAKLLYLYDPFDDIDYASAKELRAKIEQMDSTKYYETLGRLIYAFGQSVNDTSNMEICTSLEDVLRLVLSLDFDDALKLKLQDLILNHEKHLKITDELLNTTYQVLKKHKKEMDGMCLEFAKYWDATLGDTDILTYFCQETGYPMEIDTRNPFGWSLRPGIFHPSIFGYALSVDNGTGEYTDHDLCTMGLLYGDDYTLKDFSICNGRMDEDQALKLLKLLSDKSKFEIIHYTKDREAYGAELAEHLGLTTATISYHTSELHLAGLLTIEKKGNKIYYSANRTTLEGLLAYLGDKL